MISTLPRYMPPAADRRGATNVETTRDVLACDNLACFGIDADGSSLSASLVDQG